jgi:hydroxymethylpyrimidine/phosphomethylpyrimidine kinase
MRTALTIAGSDSGGGAGIQADLKTFAAYRVYGTSAVTAVTAQNTRGVQARPARPAWRVVSQIEYVVRDIGADAVKIGMLGNAGIGRAVAQAIADHARERIVLDPVRIAKGGDRLLEQEAVEALRTHLLPRAHVVTPNIPEAEVLTGGAIRSLADMHAAAAALARTGARVVLVKGGHGEGPESIDVAWVGSRTIEIAGPRLATRHTHGTGCTLSSAIAANLAKGLGDEEALRDARQFVEGAIRHAPGLGAGHGPLDHMWRVY